MSRPARVLHWTGPSEAEHLRARARDLKAALAEVEDRLHALATAPAAPPMPAPPSTLWLTPAAASAQYGWKAQTLRHWARAGKVRTKKLEGCWVIAVADLDARQADGQAALAGGEGLHEERQR